MEETVRIAARPASGRNLQEDGKIGDKAGACYTLETHYTAKMSLSPQLLTRFAKGCEAS